jgi:hypothetical protein
MAACITGCASAPQVQLPSLPPGSYAYGQASYSQSSGGKAALGVHIPLDYAAPTSKSNGEGKAIVQPAN